MRVLTITVLLIASIINTATAQKIIDEDKKVLKLIATLPEVIKANNYVIKHSNGKRSLATVIESRPTKQHNCYQLSVAEYNGMNLVSHFRFIVDARTYSIKFWAVAEDKLITLQAWRQHHYKDY
jgi:hypothetical protein